MKNHLILLAAVAVLAAAQGATAATTSPAPAPSDAKAAFERLKQLAGTWTMPMPETKAEMKADAKIPPQATVNYKLTGGGSAVTETLFPGTEHEMLTVYHLDGNDLVLTHYCAAGNQPRMKAAIADGGKTLAFHFVGGSNIVPDKDVHMHEATIKFVDADHVHAEWMMWQGGKQAEVKEFELTRQKN